MKLLARRCYVCGRIIPLMIAPIKATQTTSEPSDVIFKIYNVSVLCPNGHENEVLIDDD